MKIIILKIAAFFIGIYVLICCALYFNQESFIFHPTKLKTDFEYNYNRNFKEVNLTTDDSKKLNSLYFEVEKPKGVVYFLHGNAGNLENWGNIAEYLDLGYNVFIIDYRGFGKSEGKIESETQFIKDAQLGYDFLKNKFTEPNIVVIGCSIGTGPASYLASVNNPKMVILQAPYTSIIDQMKVSMPFIPTFILKYKFENDKNIQKVKCPVFIFHGNDDSVISYHKSLELKKYLKERDEYITLENQGHIGINDNYDYQVKIKEILM